VAILEKEQGFDPAVVQHWHRIYAVDLVDAEGRSLKFEGDATLHVLFQIYLKDEHYSKMWSHSFVHPAVLNN
jgi:hypothetical protein